MENEWLDVACINHEKYIMHGQIVVNDFQTVQIEQVLTQEQKEKFDELMFKQEREVRKLLKSFINE